MRNVIILGSGGVAAEITFYIEDHNSKCKKEDQIKLIGYIDYAEVIDKFWKKYNFKAPVLCDIDSYIPGPNEEIIIGIGNVKVRSDMIQKLVKKKAKIGNFVHHSAIKSKAYKWGIGNVVFPFCIIEQNAVVGNYNLLTSYSFISHDCVVGNNNFLSTAGLAGNVKVGDNNFFGIRSTVIPGIEIGNNNVIQAGMTIDKNVKDDTTVFYRYKEKVLAIPK
jgi:acetyltransferase-like isoleucine patch superfamily enzyme